MLKDVLGDIGELTSISKSGAFRMVLEKRKAYLQAEVNRFVREKDLTEAYGAVKRLDDIDKLMDMVERTIEDLKKGGS